MPDRNVDSGFELVLDNRKLIIAFAILIAICGCFYVLGFIQGKRQGFQAGSLAATPSVPKTTIDEMQPQTTGPANSIYGTKPVKERTGKQPFDWNKSVDRIGGAPQRVRSASRAGSAPKTASSGTLGISKSQAAHSAPATYSVQIGAFRQKREAEAKAKELRGKGYEIRIESPHPPEQLYLLKVGTFKSRADAVAMQLRLKKNGISGFIKTN
jgi:cell division protein FtsN